MVPCTRRGLVQGTAVLPWESMARMVFIPSEDTSKMGGYVSPEVRWLQGGNRFVTVFQPDVWASSCKAWRERRRECIVKKEGLNLRGEDLDRLYTQTPICVLRI